MERPPIELSVHADPAPQGSKRCFQGRVVDANSEKLKKWRKEVKRVAIEYLHKNGWKPFVDAVGVEIVFYMPRPKTVKRELPTVPPDLDKMIRSVFDSLTDGEIWGDDSQVCSVTAHKVYADGREPGAEIKVFSITN